MPISIRFTLLAIVMAALQSMAQRQNTDPLKVEIITTDLDHSGRH
jgi:hypothetical protein